jgi:predicted ATPase
MYIEALKIEGIRGFVGKDKQIGFSKGINIIVGPNNSGKSTILKALHILQKNNNLFDKEDVSKNVTEGTIEIGFNDPTRLKVNPRVSSGGRPQPFSTIGRCTYSLFSSGATPTFFLLANSLRENYTPFPNIEPNNLIYPYLSKRKVAEYNHSIGETATNSITGDLSFLSAKIDRLIKPGMESYNEYMRACSDIFGKDFLITTTSAGNGKKAGLILSDYDSIFIDRMGEGVAALLGLITNLCMAKDKIFLIEELENDIHPKALKSILKLIESKSRTNQFFISTHSNIVTKYLGASEHAKVFRTSLRIENKIPITEIEEVPNEINARLKILEDLGYEPSDYGLWKAYLFLEESSAETIIREFLIPIFTPELTTVIKTFSARGVDTVLDKFDDFNRLFVFLHLEPSYKNKIWVVIDGGDTEKGILNKFIEVYVNKNGWDLKHFSQFKQHAFENYYPERFKAEAAKILAIGDKKTRWKNKKELLEKVIIWSHGHKEDAKTEWEKSAKEVIDKLKEIEKQLVADI